MCKAIQTDTLKMLYIFQQKLCKQPHAKKSEFLRIRFFRTPFKQTHFFEFISFNVFNCFVLCTVIRFSNSIYFINYSLKDFLKIVNCIPKFSQFIYFILRFNMPLISSSFIEITYFFKIVGKIQTTCQKFANSY